jgi:hypothetical protein
MTIEIVLLSPDRESAYAEFVQSHPTSLISYTLRYRNFLMELLGCQARYAMAVRNGEVLGVLPMMIMQGSYGPVLNALPYFGSSGAPLVIDAGAAELLMDWFSIEAADAGVAASTMIGNPLAPGPTRPHEYSDYRIAHITPLTGEGEPASRISALIDPSARRNVQKAQRCGTEVTIQNDAFDKLEALHRASMEAIGAQVKSRAFFEGVPRHFQPGVDYDLYLGRIDGAPAGALLIFYCGKTVDYFMPAANPEHRSSQPMAAILLEAMAEAARRGYTTWNWGGSWPTHESLQRFKAKWGGQPSEYHYATNVGNAALLKATKEELLAQYPGFFVGPFHSLQQD